MQVLAVIDGVTAGDPRPEAARSDGIFFRPLRSSDLPLIHRWLNAPHVARWYGEDTSWRGIEEKYFPRIEDREPVEPYVILYEERPIGYIQTYPISHDEEYARLVGIEDSAGVDLLTGEEDCLYRGLGSLILRRFLGEVVFQKASVRTCVIGPETKNTAAIRTYEKAGFRRVGVLRRAYREPSSGDWRDELLMELAVEPQRQFRPGPHN